MAEKTRPAAKKITLDAFEYPATEVKQIVLDGETDEMSITPDALLAINNAGVYTVQMLATKAYVIAKGKGRHNITIEDFKAAVSELAIPEISELIGKSQSVEEIM